MTPPRKLWLTLGLSSLAAGGFVAATGHPVVGCFMAGTNLIFAVVGIWKNIPFN